MQTRKITVQNILFFDTVSAFSVLSIFILSFCPLIEVNFLFFVHFCKKTLSTVRRCTLQGGLILLKKTLSSFGKFCFVRLWEVSAVRRVRLQRFHCNTKSYCEQSKFNGKRSIWMPSNSHLSCFKFHKTCYVTFLSQ